MSKSELILTKTKLLIKRWIGAGSFIVFLSWIAQNYMQKDWQSEITSLEREKLAISFNEMNKNQFQIFLNFDKSHSSDTSYINNQKYALTAYNNYSNLLQYLGKNISTENDKLLNKYRENFDLIQKKNDMFSKRNDINSLFDLAYDLSQWENNNGYNIINKYQERLKKFKKKEDLWNRIYLFLYLIGGVCLSIAFMLDYKLIKKTT